MNAIIPESFWFISLLILFCFSPIQLFGQITSNNITSSDPSILGSPTNNASIANTTALGVINITDATAQALSNITNATSEALGNLTSISAAPANNATIVDATTVIDSIFQSGLPIIFIVVIAVAMVIPLCLDMILAYVRKSKEGTAKESSVPVGMPGLYRTLMTFGIVLLVGTVVFYVLALTTLNINNPTNPILQSLVEILKNLSTILGTALATIIAFYFGMRGAEVSAEKAAAAAKGGTDKTSPTVIGTAPNDGDTGVPGSSPITATFSEAMRSSTVNTNTFTLKRDGTTANIAGTVTLSSDGKTAILDPTTDLAAAKYIATISKEVTDLAGNSLAAPKIWSFTTL